MTAMGAHDHAPQHASSPAMRLHHVGYTVREIEAVAALYVARFGYQVATPILQ